MTKDTFTQKEILIELMKKVQETHDTLLRHMAHEESQLSEMIEHQKKTNGRVTRLEDEVDALAVKQENLGVKVAAGVLVASLVTAEIVRNLL
jgi:hypothetical protein